MGYVEGKGSCGTSAEIKLGLGSELGKPGVGEPEVSLQMENEQGRLIEAWERMRMSSERNRRKPVVGRALWKPEEEA